MKPQRRREENRSKSCLQCPFADGRDGRTGRTLRLLSALLALLLLLALLVGCAPRGVYTDALGASYRFRSSRYTHTDSRGNVTQGRYEIDGDTITFSPRGSTPFSLPYQKDGNTLIIGDIQYVKK